MPKAEVAQTGSIAPQAAAPAPAPAIGFRWPAKGRVIAGFGGTSANEGINIALPEGTPVKAAEDGTVAYAGSDVKGYGKLVLIRHDNGYVSAYAHNGEIAVKHGEKVKRGQAIAKSGQSGNVTSPQLHFEIRKGAQPVDPMPHLQGGKSNRLVRPESGCSSVRRSASVYDSFVPSLPGQILDELPGDAARARAARRRPFQRLGADSLAVADEAEVVGVAERPCRGIRPGCSGGSRARARSGRTATPSPRPPRPD